MVVRISCSASIVLLSMYFGASILSADGDEGADRSGGYPSKNVLDGKRFVGEIGPMGESAVTDDLLVFEEGMFVSKECERRCGYTEGPYWIRYVQEGVRMTATLSCSKSDATLVWNGIVRGDEIEGTIKWTSERWYWTIEKELWFKGSLATQDGESGSGTR